MLSQGHQHRFLPQRRAIAALRDVEKNDGIMLEPETAEEAAMLWRSLREIGWVKGYAITFAGRSVLARVGQGPAK